MDEVDEDKSGQIEFNEFLSIIKCASNRKKAKRSDDKEGATVLKSQERIPKLKLNVRMTLKCYFFK